MWSKHKVSETMYQPLAIFLIHFKSSISTWYFGCETVPLNPTLQCFCSSSSCRHLTTTTTTEVAAAAAVTVPEATLLCHTAIWQSVSSDWSSSCSPSSRSAFSLNLPPSLSVSADRHLSKTRGQQGVGLRNCLRVCAVVAIDGFSYLAAVLFILSFWLFPPAPVPFIYTSLHFVTCENMGGKKVMLCCNGKNWHIEKRRCDKRWLKQHCAATITDKDSCFRDLSLSLHENMCSRRDNALQASVHIMPVCLRGSTCTLHRGVLN